MIGSFLNGVACLGLPSPFEPHLRLCFQAARVHFALNCMVQGCPRLPREPFEADRLAAQLDAAATLFFSEARNVELQPDRKVVRFSEILSFYTKDFLARAPTLIDYANRYRSEKIPTDWKVEFIPYNWKINKQ